MWQKITSAFAKRRALKKLHIRINQGSIGLHKKQLVLEPGVSLAAAKLAAGRLHIGAMTYLRSGCELGNVCSIGRFCSIGNNVILGQERTGHPLNWVSTHPFQHSMASQRYELTREPTQVDHDV